MTDTAQSQDPSGDPPGQPDPLVRPPDLRQDTERSATRLELFFDLAFVLVLARIADRLVGDVSWRGVGVASGLVVLAWWAWATSTLYANRFDTDDLVFRLAKLTGMLAVLGMAASVTDLGGANGVRFALCFAALRFILAGQYLRAWRHVETARGAIKPYLVAHTVAGLLWVVSAAAPAPGRYWLWALALAVDLSAPVLATRSEAAVPLHLEHLPERYGLFVILVLGESVVGVATGVEHAHWTLAAAGSAVLAFVVSAALWWSYFDLAGATAKRGLLAAGETSRFGVHDVYLFAHLPVALALAFVGVALEQTVSHAGDRDLADPYTYLLAGGVALYLAAAAVLTGVLSGRASAGFPVLAVPVALAIALLPSPPLLLALLAALLVGVIVVGQRQQRAGRLETEAV